MDNEKPVLVERLNSEIRSCTRCELHKFRNKAVPGEGNINADLFFIGEAPGRKEDLTGRPFVGRSGRFLNDVLRKFGIERDEVFITSVLKSRPPKNRSIRKSWVKACLPYLTRQIDIIKPKIVVLLGGLALKALLGFDRVSEVHGRIFLEDGVKFIPTFHPASALRFPKIRALFIEDFEVIRNEYWKVKSDKKF